MRTWREIRNDICPVSAFCYESKDLVLLILNFVSLIVSLSVQALSLQQLERIVGMYWDDMSGTNVLSAEVC